jgi:hypothetical protein
MECTPLHLADLFIPGIMGFIVAAVVISVSYSCGADSVRSEAVKLGLAEDGKSTDFRWKQP